MGVVGATPPTVALTSVAATGVLPIHHGPFHGRTIDVAAVTEPTLMLVTDFGTGWNQ
jgi:hypothetical protein